MAFELREGQGSLFKNEKRDKDTQPHARGDALIGGVLYQISAWTKEGAKGRFQSLSFQPKEQRQDQARQSARRDRDDPRTSYDQPAHDLDSDEVPF